MTIITTNYLYNNWPNCIELKNESLRLVITTDIGPRIIYCGDGSAGGNLFYQKPDEQGLTLSSEYLLYGGHRFCHSPQIGNRPCQPDNIPVPYTVKDNTVTLNCPEETETKMQKMLTVNLVPDKAQVKITHQIYNRSLWPITFASWALTQMRESGIEILPVPTPTIEDSTDSSKIYLPELLG